MDHRSAAARCSSCGAGLAPDAPWCSLCFAPVPVADPVVVQPEPEPPIQIAHAAAVAPVHVAEPHSLYPDITPERLGRHARPAEATAVQAVDEPFRLRAAAQGVPQPRLVEPRSVVAAAPTSEEVVGQDGPAWPCINCGATVPMAADVCPECGKGFLAGLIGTTPTLVLPVVGDITTKSPAQRYAIAAAIGLSAAVLVVGLVALIGSIF